MLKHKSVDFVVPRSFRFAAGDVFLVVCQEIDVIVLIFPAGHSVFYLADCLHRHLLSCMGDWCDRLRSSKEILLVV